MSELNWHTLHGKQGIEIGDWIIWYSDPETYEHRPCREIVKAGKWWKSEMWDDYAMSDDGLCPKCGAICTDSAKMLARLQKLHEHPFQEEHFYGSFTGSYGPK